MLPVFMNARKSSTEILGEDAKRKNQSIGVATSIFQNNFPAPAQKAASGLSASGNAPTMLLPGSAVQARKAAEEAAGRVVVQKRAVVMRMAPLDRSLSANAVTALDYVVTAWQRAGRKAVQVLADDLAKGTKMRVEQARAALDELRGTGHLADVTDSFGKRRIMPTSKVTQGLAD